MKRSNLFLRSLLFIIPSIILISSCSKDGAIGPQGPAGTNASALKGNMVGYVLLDDEYGFKLPGNISGAQVIVQEAHDTVYTDSTGRYEIDNLEAGIYNILISKNGYGSDKIISMQFEGGGTFYRANITLAPIPDFNITAMHDSTNGTNVFIRDSISVTDTKNRAFIVFAGSSPAVSSSPADYLNFYFGTIMANSSAANLAISINSLNSLGFVSGQRVYFASYTIGAGSTATSSYEDFSTGRTIFTDLSAVADTASILLP